jgi:hypothetical protein
MAGQNGSAPRTPATMKVVVWNMSFVRSRENWRKFEEGGELACDLALLNEARPRDDGPKLHVLTDGKTIGRDDVTNGGKKKRGWAAAVASRFELRQPEDVWALPPNNGDRRSMLEVSRPGSWKAGVIEFSNGERVTAISLYGLLDERSDASVHRSLSDLTPLIEDARYNKLLLLGGDLNTLCTGKAGSRYLERDLSVVSRITDGFGLVDLLQESLRQHRPRRGRLEGCKCSFGTKCRHTWTYRRTPSSRVAYQDDYLFASPALARRLVECEAIPFGPGSTSDHAPIVATFKMPRPRVQAVV